MNLSVVVPIFQQTDKIQMICDTLDHGLKSLNLDYEILLFDNASSPQSRKLLEDIVARRRQIKFFSSQKPLGFGRSLRELLGKAQGDAIVYIDATLLAGLRFLPVLIGKMQDTDILIASRFGHQKKGEDPSQSFLFLLYRLVCRFFLSLPYKDIQPKFVIFHRDILSSFKLKADDHNLFPELFVKAKRKKLIVQEVLLETQFTARQPLDTQRCSFLALMRLFWLGS